MPSLLLAHPQETYSKDPHTSSGSLRWMWFHSQKHRSFGPKNEAVNGDLIPLAISFLILCCSKSQETKEKLFRQDVSLLERYS